MAPLIKGAILGIIGAVVLAPIALVLALFGIPLFVAGAIVLGTVLAIPLIIVAVLSIPFIAVAGVLGLVVAVAFIIAIKIAIWVVLPVVIVGLLLGWLVRTSRQRQGLEA